MPVHLFPGKTNIGNILLQFKSVQTEDVMDSKFRCVFDDTANLVQGSAIGSSGVVGKQAAAYGGESDGDSGNDKDLTEAFSGAQRTNAGDHDAEPSAPAYSSVSSLAKRGEAFLNLGHCQVSNMLSYFTLQTLLIYQMAVRRNTL